MNNRQHQSNSKRIYILVGTILGLGLSLASCSGSQESSGSAGVDSARSAATRPSDYSITAWVREALELDPRVASGDIQIDTVDGIVTMSGTVSNLLERRYARLEADKIAGVKGVIDEIVVAPSFRPDSDIKHDVELRLANSPYGRFRNLTAFVVHGDVKLVGDVPSWAQREEAEMLVSEIRGVRSVANDLLVDLGPGLSDEVTRDAIVAELDRDPYLTGLPITVQVEDGIVTLEGTVGNGYEKERAEDDAHLAASIRELDNKLYVDWFEERGVRETTFLPDDDQLKHTVREVLDVDSRLVDPTSIDLEVSNGHVTLTGSVPYYSQKRIAEEDARDLVGVTGITNLVYSTEDQRDDEVIKGAVMIDLDIDYALNGRDIGVGVHDGEVTLSGTVDSFYQKRHATEVASRVGGVRGVINEITVNFAPEFTDAAIAELISKHLASNWRTRPVADRIHVTVEDGHAILSGEVDDWPERSEADRLARLTEGVSSVEDDLTVEFP